MGTTGRYYAVTRSVAHAKFRARFATRLQLSAVSCSRRILCRRLDLVSGTSADELSSTLLYGQSAAVVRARLLLDQTSKHRAGNGYLLSVADVRYE